MSEVRLTEHGGYVFLVRLALTPRQLQLVQNSLPGIASRSADIATLFYDRLFSQHPELRGLFPENLAGQKKKLVAMLSFLVTNLHRINEIAPEIYELGRRHHSYDVSPDHYAYVGDALIWSLRRVLGLHFTPDLRDAWLAVYRMVAQVMQELGRAPRDQHTFFPGLVESVLDSHYGMSEREAGEESGGSIIASDAGEQRGRRKVRAP
jgi:hemoglobin-like flavoprotein